MMMKTCMNTCDK